MCFVYFVNNVTQKNQEIHKILSVGSHLAALAVFVVKETVRVKAECVLGRELTAAAATAAECPERQRER